MRLMVVERRGWWSRVDVADQIPSASVMFWV